MNNITFSAMKLINQKGIRKINQLICDAAKYPVKITGLDEHKHQIEIGIAADNMAAERLKLFFLIKKISVKKYHNTTTGWFTFSLIYKDLFSLLKEDDIEEVRVWRSHDRFFKCSEMDHQHLSNTIHYLEILIKEGRISTDGANDYLAKLKESVIPEIEERFDGQILEYVKRFNWG